MTEYIYITEDKETLSGKEITRVYLIISRNKDTGNEGVFAIQNGQVAMQAVTSDKALFEKIKKSIKDIPCPKEMELIAAEFELVKSDNI